MEWVIEPLSTPGEWEGSCRFFCMIKDCGYLYSPCLTVLSR